MHRTADYHLTARSITTIFLCLLLGACAGQKPKPPTAAEQSVARLQYWTIKGKLGVRAPHDSGSANLTWEQRTAPSYRIHLSGPLGAGATVISGTPGGVTLQRGDEPPLRASNPAALTVQALGWPMPITEMFYWVRGLAAPGSAPSEEHRDAAGLLQSLQQAGWNLTFSGYQNRGPYVLPTKIKASTDQGAGPVKVTLVIKEWQL
ncbi:lipoprotein insertase outer membrane protein LolB [Microbulbifer sp. SAOS-129_SWC]|uniref:lipoprotein insertase outer membrane protein LolB n=1 Tax=Microbulbifer sp. SAOS-129_SWC TaxID=3145235 RepID=UPI003216ACBE